ncbi:SRPBCC family protein [Mycobacterium sp. SMC-2]|uniref:SRPBCC family protein n=1 Tax=Mycobacterium sp. SMC-2 TaxID=2857058 RepID=UPI0021B451AC|nr:SRPBCC family protein [Mycobacterium sp. SMC-2]UXA06908.1 SRPBCC family protein [Mycobacterium sp. SMC-2]
MGDRSASTTSALVKVLSGASFGLGLSELLVPDKVAAVAGVDDTDRSRRVIRALGARECGHGAALLVGPDKLVWTRVAGDVLDIALLVAGVAARGPGRRRRGTVSAMLLTGIGGLDLYAALRTVDGGGRHVSGARHRTLRAAVTVQRPTEEVYRFWRDLENLPSFMQHLKSVTPGSDGQSHWVANAPAGQSAQWDAQITEDDTNRRIAWQSLPGSAIENGGSVEFTPTATGDGTEVRVRIGYHIPGGVFGKAAASLFGESPEQQVNDDLRRFKQILETGQVLRSDGSPGGTAAVRQMHQQPAQPNKGASV